MSTHETNVVRLGPIAKHPNADKLGITKIYDYNVVVNLSDWHEGDLGVYIEPDYVVPDTAQFAFLGSSRRIKVKKLRGVMSQGLLIPAPVGAVEGANVMDELGIVRYEPPMKGIWLGSQAPGPAFPGPSGIVAPKYDLENGRKYRQIVDACELLYITEKLHGCNARFVHDGTRLHIGSRTTWKDPAYDTVWNKIARQEPWITEFCAANVGAVLYGEIFGAVQDLRYGCVNDEVRFAAFDIYRDGEFWGVEDFTNAVPLNLRVPIVAIAKPWEINAFVDGPSLIAGANHIREGIVVRPWKEAKTDRLERIAYKFVSDAYLERA